MHQEPIHTAYPSLVSRARPFFPMLMGVARSAEGPHPSARGKRVWLARLTLPLVRGKPDLTLVSYPTQLREPFIPPRTVTHKPLTLAEH